MAEGPREEGDGHFDLVDNVGLPVPAGRVDFEGAQEDVARRVFSLRRAVGVEVGDVDNLVDIEHASSVDGNEDLESHLCGGIVKVVESGGEVGGIVRVVNGKGVEAGALGQADVAGIVIVRGWVLDHVVGEDHGSGRALGEGRMGVSVRMRMSVTET